jgi:hypothetical protein
MRDTNELIVGFRRGVSEDSARSAVEGAGGKVRRRMRTDHDDEVMLLVKTKDPAALQKSMQAHADVTHTEINSGDFHI